MFMLQVTLASTNVEIILILHFKVSSISEISKCTTCFDCQNSCFASFVHSKYASHLTGNNEKVRNGTIEMGDMSTVKVLNCIYYLKVYGDSVYFKYF